MRIRGYLGGTLALACVSLASPVAAQDVAQVLGSVGHTVLCCEFEIGYEGYEYYGYSYGGSSGSCLNNVDPYACMLFGGSPGIGACDAETGSCAARLPTCCQYDDRCTSRAPIGGAGCSADGGIPVLGTCNLETFRCDPAGPPAPPAP